MPNSPIKELFYLINLTLVEIWMNFIVYSLALDKSRNLQEIWRVTKSLFFRFIIFYAFSSLIFIIIILAGFIFYGTAYMMIFDVSINSIPSPNFFIFNLFLRFFAYLTLSILATFSFLDVVIKQSGIFVCYRQAIKILMENIGHLLRLAFLVAFIFCLYNFITLITQFGLSINAVIGLSLKNVSSFTDLPTYRIMNALYSFITVPFITIITVLSYLNFTGQMPLQSQS